MDSLEKLQNAAFFIVCSKNDACWTLRFIMVPSLTSLQARFSGRLLSAPDDEPFLVDWRRRWRGRALAVAQPDTTADVAAILGWCHEYRVPVVPQGGNTGLSGGATPDASGDALVLSLTRLNQIRNIDVQNGAVTVEAGCTLRSVQIAAEGVNLLFPLSLAAEGSCTIGGNLATNAGGVHVLRYGNCRELCLGLEVVTVDGRIWNGLRGLRKDNTGYALRELFIGSEGTLGVITAAVMKLYPRRSMRHVALTAVSDPAAAIGLLQHAQTICGDSLIAFELLSSHCLDRVVAHVPGSRKPFHKDSPWYVLIETTTSSELMDGRGIFEQMLATALNQGCITDALLAESLAQSAALWRLREAISESLSAHGPHIKHDVSLPISRMAEFIERAHHLLESRHPDLQPYVFGHVGDGNLHYNVGARADSKAREISAELENAVNELIHDEVDRCSGCISAEHGIGVLRRDELRKYQSGVERDLRNAIKRAFDPLGLMNPGKLLHGGGAGC